jgi:HEPN domain-containing protein
VSYSGNKYQAERWLITAQEDLRAAKKLLAEGFCAQACFWANQAGEKAVRAMWHLVDCGSRSHSVKRLIVEFPHKDNLPDVGALEEKAALLDKFYIPTRYPNGLPDLTPGQIYGKDDAQRGIEAIEMLIAAAPE